MRENLTLLHANIKGAYQTAWMRSPISAFVVSRLESIFKPNLLHRMDHVISKSCHNGRVFPSKKNSGVIVTPR